MIGSISIQGLLLWGSLYGVIFIIAFICYKKYPEEEEGNVVYRPKWKFECLAAYKWNEADQRYEKVGYLIGQSENEFIKDYEEKEKVS